MDIFPTQYSTLSAPALGAYISRQYDLGALSCRFLLRGVSDTYELTGPQGKYILKIYRDAHRKPDEIKGEIELLTLLKAGGAAVAWPLTDRQGSRWQVFQAAEGTRYGVLFTFAPGAPVMFPGEEQIAITGQEMAKVHTITSSVTLRFPRRSYNHQTTLLDPLATLEPAFHELPAEYRYLQDTASLVIHQLDALGVDTFPTGYCQFDFLPKNFHFDEQNRLTFFDFDFAGKGVIVNDLMTYWVHFALHAALGRQSREKSDRDFTLFLEAYTRVRAVSPQEIAAIPWLQVGFWVFYLGFHYEHFDDFSTPFFNTGFLRERVGLVRKLVDMYAA